MDKEAQHIILTESRQLFEKYGLKSVSMDDIAKKLGMSKKTLYQYFEGKGDLVNKIITAYLAEEKAVITEINSLSNDAIDEMIRIARYVINFITDMNPSLTFDLKKYYPDSWSIIEEDHMKFVEHSIVTNINRGQLEGVYRQDVHAEIIGALYVSNVMNIVLYQMSKSEFNPGDIFKEMILYHLHGIMSEKGKLLFKQNKTSTYAQV